MLYFIAAVYNEEQEVTNLIQSISDLVDNYIFVDDGSTDQTWEIITRLSAEYPVIAWKYPHTGLPETVKNTAKELVPDGSWILMLDADERLTDEAKAGIKEFFATGEDANWDYVYFDQLEIIDGQHVRSFNKCKLFRKEVVTFPLNNIHADDQFTGRGTSRNWTVLHRKSSGKQVIREVEYLKTYEKLLEDGHIDKGRYEWLRGLHHYVK